MLRFRCRKPGVLLASVTQYRSRRNQATRLEVIQPKAVRFATNRQLSARQVSWIMAGIKIPTCHDVISNEK
jgi:hypothetical protein